MFDISDKYEELMKEALKEARSAYKAGEVPVGALLLDKNGKVLSKAYNLKEALNDPSAHAEILALRSGAKILRNWRLDDCTLVVTKEPCIMCSGAILNFRLGKLVYGCQDEKAGGVDSLYKLLGDSRLNHQVEVESSVLEEECATLLKDFFLSKRKKP